MLNLNLKKNQDTATVTLEGRLDTITAPELEKELKAVIPEVKELVLDLAELAYISSAGLRVLLSAEKIMSKTGGMKLTNVGETVMEIFEVTGFSEILTIE